MDHESGSVRACCLQTPVETPRSAVKGYSSESPHVAIERIMYAPVKLETPPVAF
jgi:hypothetical protein